jgi:regulator of replication initiation timing
MQTKIDFIEENYYLKIENYELNKDLNYVTEKSETEIAKFQEK